MANEPGAPQVPATGDNHSIWHRFAWNLTEGRVTAEEVREEPIDYIEPGLGYNPTQMDRVIDQLQRVSQQPRVPLEDVFTALRIVPLDTDA